MKPRASFKRTVMVKKTASQEWGHTKENAERFAAAMQAARDQVPKEERWRLSRDHSHMEMAHGHLWLTR